MWFSKVCEGSLLDFLRKHFQPLWTALLWFSQHLFSFIWCSSFANNIQSIWSSKFQLQLDWELAWNTLLWIRIGTCWKIVIFVGLPVSFQSFLIFYLPVTPVQDVTQRLSVLSLFYGSAANAAQQSTPAARTLSGYDWSCETLSATSVSDVVDAMHLDMVTKVGCLWRLLKSGFFVTTTLESRLHCIYKKLPILI